jgi:proteasome accessory factor B
MNKKNSEEKVKFSRLLRIDAAIRSGTYPNSEELAAKEEVSPRTILRDIDYLRYSYDAPLEYDFIKRGFYYTEPNFFIRSVMLSKEELETITDYDRFSKFSANDENPTSLKFRKIIDKLLMVIPEEYSNSVPFYPTPNSIDDTDFHPSITFGGEPTILGEAIKNKEVVEIEYWYTDNRKYSKITIEPLFLFFTKFNYYLLAYKNDNHDKPGIYSINRIRNIRNTSNHFDVPANFKISDYVKKGKEADVSPADNKLYHFELVFPKEVASEAIEKTYYHNQHIKLCEDGSACVSFRSTQLYQVYYWVLGEGHRVKVLNPPELVKMLKREVQKLVEYYL